VDPTASEALADSVAMLHERGQVLGIARASEPVTHMLDQYGITASIGEDRLYPINRPALAAFLDAEPPGLGG
jgi:MFS superfamily sulfate permease-like transporter